MTKGSFLPRLWGQEPDNSGLTPLRSLQREIERLFDRFDGPELAFPWEGMENGHLTPRLDVRETDTEIELSVEMPGVLEKDIDVSLSDDELTIRGEKKVEHDKEEDGRKITERSYGTFERSMRVPAGIDPDKVEAKLAKGVLSVTLPKPPEAKETRRKIDIKSAA